MFNFSVFNIWLLQSIINIFTKQINKISLKKSTHLPSSYISFCMQWIAESSDNSSRDDSARVILLSFHWMFLYLNNNIYLPCLLYGDDFDELIVLLLLLLKLTPILLLLLWLLLPFKLPVWPTFAIAPMCIGLCITLDCWKVYDSWRLMCLANGFMSPSLGTVFKWWIRCIVNRRNHLFPPWICFFWRAREFWNHTWVTRLLRPVTDAIRSRSCPSGLLSMLKFACRICNCSSVKVVRTRLLLLFFWNPSASHPSEKGNIHLFQTRLLPK